MDEAVNTAIFASYLDQVLGPELVPGNVVILDNLPARKAAGLVEARTAKRLFLPPYSPNFNLAFSKLKNWLRTPVARTRLAQDEVPILTQALSWMSEADVKNWLDHCGYYRY